MTQQSEVTEQRVRLKNSQEALPMNEKFWSIFLKLVKH